MAPFVAVPGWLWLPMGLPTAPFVAVPGWLWLPMGLPTAPFVAVPGLCLAPNGAPFETPNGSLCGNTMTALAPSGAPHSSLCGSTRMALAPYGAPQWLPLWQYLRCRAGPEGSEHHIDDALRCQHVAPNHRRLRGRAEDGTFRKEHPHRGQAALRVINALGGGSLIKGVVNAGVVNGG